MTGRPGRSGPRKMPHTALREALDQLEGDIPDLLERLKTIAAGHEVVCSECGQMVDVCPKCGATVTLRVPDIEAAKYLVDRILGKPALKLEIDVLQKVELSPEQHKALLERAAQAREQFLAGEWLELEDDTPVASEDLHQFVPDDGENDA